MISQPAIEKLEKEAFRGPLLTLAALFLIAAGLTIIGLAAFFWVDVSESSNVVYSSSLETRTSAPPADPIALHQADLGSRAEWLALLPYQGITLMLVGVGLLLWRWVAAVRLRMTVSALILPSLRSKENLDRAESGTSASGVPASDGEPIIGRPAPDAKERQ